MAKDKKNAAGFIFFWTRPAYPFHNFLVINHEWYLILIVYEEYAIHSLAGHEERKITICWIHDFGKYILSLGGIPDP